MNYNMLGRGRYHTFCNCKSCQVLRYYVKRLKHKEYEIQQQPHASN